MAKADRCARKRRLVAESLEARNLLTTIQILAAGARNDEQVELRIDNAVVATWSSLGGDAEAGEFVTLEYNSPLTVTPERVRVAFTNDLYDPVNGIDRNVRIDALVIDGQRFETEAASVFSTGTWKPEDGITHGFRQSEWLHGSGYFQYAASTTSGSELRVRVAGDEGDELFDLRIDNVTVGSYAATTDFQIYAYNAAETITPDRVRVVFLNDRWDPAAGIDRNLIVDYLSIDGDVYETEAANVYSTGTWKPEDGITFGFRESQVLHASGYFQYAQALQPGVISLQTSVLSVSEGDGSVAVTILRQNGSDGVVTVDYRTVAGTASAGSDFVPQTGTLQFADGEVSRTINIPLLDDTLVEGNEQFGFAIDNVQGGATLLVPRTATITINDNDSIQAAGVGLLGEYFDGPAFTSRFLNRVDATVDFDWALTSPAAGMGVDDFTVRWSGEIEPRFSQLYTFETVTDDGVRLWVNGQRIIDSWVDQPATSRTGTIALNAGQRVDIRMEYYERGGQSVARLFWQSASQTREIVPQSQLYPADAPPPIPGGNLQQQTLLSGLAQPTSLDFSPDGRLMFVAEQRGIVRVVENGVLRTTPFLDFRDRINGTRDRGLLDIAVHPDFPEQPYFYLLYTYDPPEVNNYASGSLAGPDGRGNRAGRLTRVTADAAKGFTTIVANSEVVLVGRNSTWQNFNGFVNSTADFNEPPAGVLPDGSNLEDFIATDSESHTVGAIEFGLDGSLFATIGDGTSYNRVDPRTVRVQDIDNLSGKILRVDPLTGAGLSDNPFFNGNPNANRSKVYQLGVRNAFRGAVHPEDGRFFVGDVGWTQWEEINVGEPGANFGWPYFEGGSGNNLRTNGYRDLPEAIAFYASNTTVTPSFYALNHAASGINAIVLGDFYSGNTYPAQYSGDLFFNDLGQGIVRNISFAADGSVASVDTFTTGAQVVVQIKQAPDGNLYYVDLDSGLVGRWVFTESNAAVAGSEALGSPVSGDLPVGSARGVVIATIDTGIDSASEAADRPWQLWVNSDEVAGDGLDNDGNGYIDDRHGYNFVAASNGWEDQSGHGTAMAYVMSHISPDVSLMPLQAFGASGLATTSHVAEAIQYAVNQGANVIVLPLTSPPDDALAAALKHAEERGVLVVAAAGNGASLEPSFIAQLSSRYANILSVGGLTDSGQLLPESNRVLASQAIQIDAPGVAWIQRGAASTTYRGTSVAAAHVAAVAAQVVAANGDLTAAQVRDVLTSTVAPVASGSDSLGTLDAAAAVQLASALTTIVIRPSADRLNVLATPGDDVVEIAMDTGSIVINGVRYADVIPAGTQSVLLRGMAGVDRLSIRGSHQAETGLLRTDYARLIGPELMVIANTFEHTTLFSGGGDDSVMILGTVGDDAATLTDATASLTHADRAVRASGFGRMTIDAQAGNDLVDVSTSPAIDRLVARPTEMLWKADGVEHRLRRFESLNIESSGEDDTAVVQGSNGSDQFYADGGRASMQAAGVSMDFLRFGKVYLRGQGGQDTVELFSDQKGSWYSSDEREARLWNDRFFVSALGMEQRTAYLPGEGSRAYLTDGGSDDTLSLYSDRVELQRGNSKDTVSGSSFVRAHSIVNGGTDRIVRVAKPESRLVTTGDWIESGGQMLSSWADGLTLDDWWPTPGNLLEEDTTTDEASHDVASTLYDVNGDGLVSPLDLLLIINELNRSRDERRSAVEDEIDYALDTSGDGLITPVDLLQVINRLNRR